MKFPALFSGALLFANAIAVPRPEIAASPRNEISQDLQGGNRYAVMESRSAQVFNQNRAGAVLLRPPEGETEFMYVTGGFTVPTAKKGNGNGNFQLSIWVGLAANPSQDVVLQGGVTISTNGTAATYQPWYGWIPDKPKYIPADLFSVKAGDSLNITMKVTSGSSGKVFIDNFTTGTQFAQEFAIAVSVENVAFHAQTADWFVEAHQEAGNLPLLINFGKLQLSACSAVTASGKEVGLTGAGIYETQTTSGQVLTKTTITGNGVLVTQN